MDKPMTSRRDFLKSGGSVMGVSWLALNSPLILAASQSAQTRLSEQAAFINISAADAVELGAIVDQIIPPDETPGATDTGVVYFIDEALGGFMAGVVPMLKQGLEDLSHSVESAGHQQNRFSGLTFEQQTALLKEVEETPFFTTLQFLTMMGMFCLPRYAGNRDNIGWDLLGFNHQHAWQPPFGYYDAALHGQNPELGDDHGQS